MQFIKIDKEFQNLLRPLTAEEHKSLEDSIKQDGCLRPIELWNGYIVDGHNRYSICMKNDIPFEQVDVTDKFETKSDVMKWIVQNQRARQTGRQLSKTELVAMADAVKEQTDKEARESYKANVGRPKNGEEKFTQNFGEIDRHKRESVAKAAESIGVSAQTYRDMKLVAEKGSEEQIERMNKGGRGNAPSAIAKEIKGSKIKETFKCRECGKLFPISEAHKRGNGKTDNICKLCHNKNNKKSHDRMSNQYEKEFQAQHNERTFEYLQMELKSIVEASVHNIMDTIKDYESREILIDEESANSIHEILSALSKIVESVKEKKND